MYKIKLKSFFDVFYTHFIFFLNTEPWKILEVATGEEDMAFMLSPTQLYKLLNKVNTLKAVGLDNIPGHVLRLCASELMNITMNIFNISLTTVPQSHPASKPPQSSLP